MAEPVVGVVALNERAQRLVRTLPQDCREDNRNFLGAVADKPCPQRAAPSANRAHAIARHSG